MFSIVKEARDHRVPGGGEMRDPGNEVEAVTDAKSAATTILLLRTNQKRFSWYHLPCSFRILINNFAFSVC